MALNSHASPKQHSGMKRSSSSDPPRASKRPSSSEGNPQVTTRAVGQTAPRLIATIKSADRQHREEHERNPYIHPPRGFDEQFDTSCRQPLYTPCKHYWTTQRSQTVLPDRDIIDPGQAYRLACFCQHCLWHVDLEIQHTSQPCPKPGYPLHHFTNFVRENEHQEWYQARCSGCAALLYIHYRRPRLRAEQIDAMTNEDRLLERLERAREADPDRGHAKPASPVEVLDAMASYLKDAFTSEDEKKIPKLNRRFVTSFGEDCRDLLLNMGFKDVGDFWTLPRPESPDPWAWNLRKQLEDTQEELWALMRSLKDNDATLQIDGRKGYNGHMEPFEEDVQLFLSTFEYDKSKTTRRTPNLTLDEQSWYSGLGCLADMSDDLVSFSYDRQIKTDVENMPYYYDCLSSIAKKRNSESLDMKMALLASEGAYGRRDVLDSYKYFVLDPHNNAVTDAQIRGTFESRMASIGKAGQTEAREKLRLIGMARGSQALLDAASDEITDHHSALRFLDPNYVDGTQYADDYVIALAGAKRAESDSTGHQERVSKALQLIANHRGSAALTAYLSTGEAPMTDDDDLAAAYRYFNIQDRTAQVDLDVLQSQIGMETENQALALKHFEVLKANHKPTETVKRSADYTKPVGLTNTRNYCYLHALLQFFYSIEPFRDTILNFDEDYRQDISQSSRTDLGRLAGSPITNLHVQDGQALVPQLTRLFKTLQSAPGPDVTPSEGVAAQAIQPPPSAPEPIAADHRIGNLDKTTEPHTNAAETPGSESSDVTLIGDVVLTPTSDADEQQKGDDKDNLQEETDSTANPPDHPPPPIPPRTAPDAPTPKKETMEEQYRQQDAHEVSSKILQRTIAAIKPNSIDADGERHDPIRDLFFSVTQYICTEDSEVQKKFTPDAASNQFLHLTHKPKDIQEGLDILFGRSTISEDETKPSTTRYQVIKQAPDILQLYVHHYKYDTADNGQLVQQRVENTMVLNEDIHLGRYMEDRQAETLSIRQQSWALRDRLTELDAKKKDLIIKSIKAQDAYENKEENVDLMSNDSLKAISNFLEAESKQTQELIDVNNTEQFIAQMKKLSEEETSQVNAIDKEIPRIREDLDEISATLDEWSTKRSDLSHLKYRLFAVFMYNGSGSAGHWYIYIRDFKAGCWRCYNDARVYEVEEKEIFRQRSTKEEHAPLVVYVRDEMKDQLIDPLHRVKPEDEDMIMEQRTSNGEFDSIDGGVALPVKSTWGPDRGVEIEEVEMKSLLDD